MRNWARILKSRVYTFDSEAHEVDNSKEKLELEREPKPSDGDRLVIDKVVAKRPASDWPA